MGIRQNATADRSVERKEWKFSELLADKTVKERWERVRKFFFLRESTYDMTNRCNIRCEGCYYYEGQKQFTVENNEPDAWRALAKAEKERGITYVVLAGAEPSLVPERLEIFYREVPWGAVATNGLKPIPGSVNYRIHISVWGDDATSLATRNAKDMLKRQIENYGTDPRAVFVYTFTRYNIDQAYPVAEMLHQNGCKLTFNMFSAPVGYDGFLRHTPDSLSQTRAAMQKLLTRYPQNILFSRYNITAHTQKTALHELFRCSYPRMNPATHVGLGRSFRQYRTDLSWDRDAACCVPDTDCADCRHYAAGSAIVTARLFRHATDPATFSSWLDYVDTYLAVWVMGYEKNPNLCSDMVLPPGNEK